MNYKKWIGNNRGLILPLTLLVFVILGALAAAILSMGGSEAQIASNHLRAVQAEFVAEAGLEHAFNTLRTAPTGSLTAVDLTPITGIADDSVVDGAGRYTVRYQAAGFWTWRVVSTGTSAIGGSQQIRRALMSTAFVSSDAIVANGSLSISGSPQVSGTNGQCGNVHSNGDLTIDGGNSLKIQGDATSTGTYTETGSPSIGGEHDTDPEPAKPLPHIDPNEFLTNTVIPLMSAGNPLDGLDHLANLYKMTVDQTTHEGKVYDGHGTPKATLPASGGTWCGWEYTYDTPLATWKTGSTTPCNGTFYAEGSVEVGSSTHGTWNTTLITTGDIKIVGNPTITANPNYTVYNTLFYSGRDIDINGTPANGYNGVIAAHEQFNLHGTGTFKGFIIGENGVTPPGTTPYNTPGSLVNELQSTVGGNITLVYDCNFTTPIPGPFRILSWGL